MFGRKKEKEVKNLIFEHLKTVEETVFKMKEAMELYIKGDYESAKEISYQVHLLEGDADSKRREIIEKLHQGAFLPTIRQDIIKLIARQDKIADRSESCCDFCISQMPDVPEEFKERFIELLEVSVSTFSPYKEALENMFIDYKIVKEKIHSVNTVEEEADTLEWRLTKEIFSSNLTLAHKMHLREYIFHIVSVSDIIEDAADALDIIIVKQKF